MAAWGSSVLARLRVVFPRLRGRTEPAVLVCAACGDLMASRFIVGDTHKVLATLPDASVDLVMTSPPFLALRSYLPADHPDKGSEIGSEATPGEFLDVLLDVVEECARVLAPHGSLVFELGDTYSGSGGAGGDYNADGLREGQQAFSGSASKRARLGVGDDYRPSRSGRGLAGSTGRTSRPDDVADGITHPRARPGPEGRDFIDGWPLDKSLCMIPSSFAWALAYGRNPWTGRETDRWRVRNLRPWLRINPPVGALGGKWRPGSSYCTVATKSRRNYFDEFAIREAGELVDWFIDNGGGYEGAHYAVFPMTLPERFITPLCPQTVCSTCGEPRRRLTEKSEEYAEHMQAKEGRHLLPVGERLSRIEGTKRDAAVVTVGWSDCGHDDYRRGIVLDPFAGSGTTLAVAEGLGRDSIGIDLDARNADLATKRCGMFLEVS